MCCCLKCLHCTALQLISACSLRAWSPVVGLKDKIPGIIDISTGTFQLPRRRVWRCMTTRLASTGCSFTARHKGYTHCLVARLKDKASLEVYQNHVAHLDLLKELAVHVENVLAGRGRCRAAQPALHVCLTACALVACSGLRVASLLPFPDVYVRGSW